MFDPTDYPAKGTLVVHLDSLVDERRRAFKGSPRPVGWFTADQRQRTSSEQAHSLIVRLRDAREFYGEQPENLLHAVAHALDHACYERGLTPQDFDSTLADAAKLLPALVAAEAEDSGYPVARRDMAAELRPIVGRIARKATNETEFFAELVARDLLVQYWSALPGTNEVPDYTVGRRDRVLANGRCLVVTSRELGPDLTLPRLVERWSAGGAVVEPSPIVGTQVPHSRAAEV